MATITGVELRESVADVLRRAEMGEEFTITRAGRPIARLGPPVSRRWVGGAALAAVFRTPPPQTLAAELEQFPGHLADPFA